MIEQDKKAIEIKELWKRWDDARTEWADHAREDIDFYLGNHFSEQEQEELKEKSYPWHFPNVSTTADHHEEEQ